MIKINTFRMAFSKTDCLFHFQTEIFFFIFFHMVNIWPPKKMRFFRTLFLLIHGHCIS